MASQLRDKLVDAAGMLALPVARWEWQYEADKLLDSTPIASWFALAKRCLHIEAIPCSPEHRLVDGAIYLTYQEQRWQVIQASAHGMTLPSQAWQIVPAERQYQLSWRSLFSLGQQEGRLITRLLWSTLVINLLAIVMPLYLNAVYDRVIPGQADSSLWALSFAVVLALLVEYVFRMERVKTGGQFLISIQQRFEPRLISDLMQVLPSQKNRWSKHILEAMSDWNRFRMQCLGLFSSSALDLAFSLLYFVVIAAVAGWLVLVPLFIFICAIVRVVFFHIENAKIPSISSYVPFSSSSLENYQACSAYRHGSLRFLSTNEKAQQAELAHFIAQNRCSTTLMALMNLQTVLAVIGAFYLVQAGNMSPAGLFVTIIIAGRLGQPLFSLMQLLPNLQRMRKSMHDINLLLNEGQEEEDNPEGYYGPQHGWGSHELGFKYHSALPCLDDIHVRIQPGERVAIVGAAGAGKSTLLKLLLGLLTPDAGHVTWNGLLLSKASATLLRRNLYYAWQDSEVIGDTLYEYLTLNSDENLSAEAVLDAMQKSRLTSLMPFLNQGVNTRWQSLPTPLTALQKQQLMLTRLLLSQHDICVLDNPSANLDPASEAILLEELTKRAQLQATLIIATDRTNLVSLMDRVIMLQSGRVVFDGKKEHFADFLNKQKQVNQMDG